MNIHIISRVFALSIILFIALGGPIMSQNPDSTQLAKEKEILTLQKEIAALEAEMAEQKKKEAESAVASLKAQLPTSETTGLDGTVTIGPEAGYHAELLAYKAMESSTRIIADRISNAQGISEKPLILIGDVDLTGQTALWHIINSKIKIAIEGTDSLLGKYSENYQIEKPSQDVPSGVLSFIPEILGAAVDIASFFKRNFTLNKKTVTINEKALIASMASEIKLKNPECKLLLPERDLYSKSLIQTDLDTLMSKRNELIAKRTVFDKRFSDKIAEGSEELVKLETQKALLDKVIIKLINEGKSYEGLQANLVLLNSKISEANKIKHNREQVISELDTHIKAINDLYKVLTEKPDDGLSPLESISAIDFIINYNKSGTGQSENKNRANLLKVIIVSQGGEIETTKKTAFASARVKYHGGAIISYFLTSEIGELITAGIEIQTETEFHKKKKVYKMKSSDNITKKQKKTLEMKINEHENKINDLEKKTSQPKEGMLAK